ncbi:MAG TPA: cytochrome c [Thermoanaerobaculia bacterium]
MIRRRRRAPRPADWLAAAALSGLFLALACGPHEDRMAEQLYPEYCARCHGTDGKGDPRRVNLYPNLDLTRSKLTGKGAHFVVYRRIAQGYGPMPGFVNRLSQVEIDRLADYSMKLNANADGARR